MRRTDTWLIVGEGIRSPPMCVVRFLHGSAVFVSRSTDGAETFHDMPLLPQRPKRSQFFDVPWIACDNVTTSPFYGNCYMVWVGWGARSPPAGLHIVRRGSDVGTGSDH